MIRLLRVGDALPERPGPDITIERIKAVMEVMDDVNPVHIDHALVKKLGLRGLVNQGPCNLSYITNMLADWARDPDAVRRLKVRFHNLVVPGDQTVAGGSITDIRDDLVDCEVWLKLRDGTVMLSGSATVCIPMAVEAPPLRKGA
jgi:acyl dehydratase